MTQGMQTLQLAILDQISHLSTSHAAELQQVRGDPYASGQNSRSPIHLSSHAPIALPVKGGPTPSVCAPSSQTKPNR